MKYSIKKNKAGKYAVKKEGAKRASKIFDTEIEARDYVKKQGGTIDAIYNARLIAKSGHKVLVWVICIIVGILGIGGGAAAVVVINNNKNAVEGVIYDGFQAHFLMLGNEYAGDCTYLKVGDVDILIDAGSRASSGKTIKTYVDKYCKDKKLEYVIATHADQDHIAAFTGKESIFTYYDCETIIDFAYSNKTTSTYNNYLSLRDEEVSNGAKHYTAKECFNNENGAQSTYQLTDYVKMTILYNKYYFEQTSDENNYSVCVLFTYTRGEDVHNFLFTGDLEKEGEEALAEYYQSHEGLGHVDLFKGGHHGSKTSSNDCLLDLITPDICCVCCCAGSTEYTVNRVNTFPTQDFIDRISKHTDRVYVTTMWNEEKEKFEALNGNIIVSCGLATITADDGTTKEEVSIGLAASNNLTKLKDSLWFSHTVYVNDKDQIVDKNAEGAKGVACRVWPTN